MYYFFKALENYATFSGRASRKEFWMFFLFSIIFIIPFSIIDGIIVPNAEFGPLATFYQLALIIPSFAISVRRMHDINRNWLFIFIPIFNFIFYLTKGDAYDNEYGPPPND